MSCTKTAQTAHTQRHTHLLLVAYPVSRLQATLQEGEAQLVYGRSVEIVLHEAVTGTEEKSVDVMFSWDFIRYNQLV